MKNFSVMIGGIYNTISKFLFGNKTNLCRY